LREILPPSVNYIDPAKYLVAAAEQELEALGLKNNNPALPTRFCVTGSPEQFSKLSKQWLGFTPIVEKVYLPFLVPADSEKLLAEN
jgi:glutamate racemase